MSEDRLTQVERMLDIIGDIDPTNAHEVALLDERDELRYCLNLTYHQAVEEVVLLRAENRRLAESLSNALRLLAARNNNDLTI